MAQTEAETVFAQPRLSHRGVDWRSATDGAVNTGIRVVTTMADRSGVGAVNTPKRKPLDGQDERMLKAQTCSLQYQQSGNTVLLR